MSIPSAAFAAATGPAKTMTYILRPRLTTHSSGRGVSLPFVVNLNGFGRCLPRRLIRALTYSARNIRERRDDHQADHGDRVRHEGLLCRGSGWLHHRLRRPTGHRLTTGCISFASETRCEDCPLWAIARALLLYAECGSLVGLAGFL